MSGQWPRVRTVEIVGANRCFGGDFTTAGDTPVSANRIARYNTGSSQWYALGGGVNATVRALDYLPVDDALYVGGEFTGAGGASQFRIARWDEDADEWLGGQFFYRLSGTAWTTEASLPVYMGDGAALVDNGDGYLYALAAGQQSDFYRYQISGNSWDSAIEMPGGATKGAALVGAGGDLCSSRRR